MVASEATRPVCSGEKKGHGVGSVSCRHGRERSDATCLLWQTKERGVGSVSCRQVPGGRPLGVRVPDHVCAPSGGVAAPGILGVALAGVTGA